MTHLLTNAKALDDLPIGTAVVALNMRYRDHAIFVKTDDTKRVDECHEPLPEAWMSPTYVSDRTASELLDESEHVQLIWTPESAVSA